MKTKKKQSDKKIANTRQGPGPKKKETSPTMSIIMNVAKKIKDGSDDKARKSAMKKRGAAKKRLDAKRKSAKAKKAKGK